MCKKFACGFLAACLVLVASQSWATDVFFSNRVFVRSQPVIVQSFGHGFVAPNAVVVNNGFATLGQPVFVNRAYGFNSFNSLSQPVVIQNFGGRGGVAVFRNGFCR